MQQQTEGIQDEEGLNQFIPIASPSSSFMPFFDSHETDAFVTSSQMAVPETSPTPLNNAMLPTPDLTFEDQNMLSLLEQDLSMETKPTNTTADGRHTDLPFFLSSSGVTRDQEDSDLTSMLDVLLESSDSETLASATPRDLEQPPFDGLNTHTSLRSMDTNSSETEKESKLKHETPESRHTTADTKRPRKKRKIRPKTQIDSLKEEVKVLTDKLQRLKCHWNSAYPEVNPDNIEDVKNFQKQKITSSVMKSIELRKKILLQQQHINHFHHFLSRSPVNHRLLPLNVLHSYIHLGTNHHTRSILLASHAEGKYHLARELVENEFSQVFHHDEYSSSGTVKQDGQTFIHKLSSKTYRGCTLDVVEKHVREMVRCAPMKSKSEGRDFSTMKDSVSLANEGDYRKVSIDVGNLAQNRHVTLASLLFYKLWHTDESLVFVVDFVDKDDLHPIDMDNNIQQDVIVVLVATMVKDDSGQSAVQIRQLMCTTFKCSSATEHSLKQHFKEISSSFLRMSEDLNFEKELNAAFPSI